MRAVFAEVDVDQVTGLGPALVNDDTWLSLFGLGRSFFNGITVRLTETTLDVTPFADDQLGNARPADVFGDIGAIEFDN